MLPINNWVKLGGHTYFSPFNVCKCLPWFCVLHGKCCHGTINPCRGHNNSHCTITKMLFDGSVQLQTCYMWVCKFHVKYGGSKPVHPASLNHLCDYRAEQVLFQCCCGGFTVPSMRRRLSNALVVQYLPCFLLCSQIAEIVWIALVHPIYIRQ